MNVGEILSRAWQIIWKNKVLWIFGILAGCGSMGGNTGSGYRFNDQNSQQAQQAINNVDPMVVALIIGAIILVVLVITIVVIFLGTVGRIGLIRGTLLADQGAAKLQFGELFSGSTPYFWRVFGLNLIVGLVMMVVFGTVIVMAVLGTIFTMGIGLICLIPLICLMIPVAWVINFTLQQAMNAIVIEDKSMLAGLQRGWEVVKANLANILIMAIILALIGLALGFLIGLPIVLIIGPAIAGLAFGSDQAIGTGFLVSALCMVVYIPVALVLQGILQAYIESAWTLTYLRLTRSAPPAGYGASLQA